MTDDVKRDRSDDPLMQRIDGALRAWREQDPDARDERELDTATAAIVDKLRSGERGRTAANFGDADLFSPPLCATTEEVQLSGPVRLGERRNAEANMAVNVGRERDRRSLQDLARLASQPAPSSVRPAASRAPLDSTPEPKEDSGLIDLRSMSEPPVATSSDAPPASAAVPVFPKASAVPVVALASAPIFDEDTAPPPSVVAAPISLDPASQVRSQAHPAPARTRGGVALAFGGLVAVAALAAGALFVVRGQQPVEAQAITTPTPAPAPIPAPPVVAKAEEPKAAVVAEPAPIVLAEQNLAAPAAKAVVAAAPVAPAAKASPPSKKEKTDPKLVANDLPASPAAASGALGDAMKNAVKDAPVPASADTPTSEPTFAPGSVPQVPSQGTVMGALGSVLPTARGCLGPDDPVSQARVNFKSSGVVDTVVVTGNAAGKPAEACIRKALSAARVPPFAQDTFSANMKIRPN